MSYLKHVEIVPSKTRQAAQIAAQRNMQEPSSSATSANYASVLQEVYEGSPLRIERYGQYDEMDKDADVNAALDTISDFSVKKDNETDEVFKITYRKEATDTEVTILKELLMQWSKINDFKRRAWRMFRNTLKYGDQFFIRDPETLKWFWVEPSKVEKIIVNEADGKKPEAYIIRDLDVNLNSLTATTPGTSGTNLTGGSSQMNYMMPTRDNQNRWNSKRGGSGGGRFQNEQSMTMIDATHVVHLSLNEGLGDNWPFGTSILESVFKTWREKSLLSEAVIIYRIQRAPERRIFYIDVGSMPMHKVNGYLEKIKTDIHQRRFPTRTGGGLNTGDTTYNPMSMMEDFFFAQTPEGRGSRVDTLPAGENLGQIDDLRFWQNALFRALRIPSSYLPTGPDDGMQTFNDGRVGTAYIQEFRFSEYCQRLQNLIAPVFDDEFKLFCKRNGSLIDSSIFELNFNIPESFGDYARMAKDEAAIAIYAPLAEMPHFSKRWLMREKLGMTEEQILDNERLWLEENSELTEGTGIEEMTPGRAIGLNNIGIRPEDSDSMDDSETGDEAAAEEGGDLDVDIGDDDMGGDL